MFISSLKLICRIIGNFVSLKVESGKHLDDRVIALRVEVWAFKYKPMHLCFV